MPTTRGQRQAAAPTAEKLKAALVAKDYITAATLVTPETLTPENRAMIEKIKTSPYVIDEKSRLKEMLNPKPEESYEEFLRKGRMGTGGRKKTRASRKTRKGGRRHKKTRRA
jgi:hypothetical protein